MNLQMLEYGLELTSCRDDFLRHNLSEYSGDRKSYFYFKNGFQPVELFNENETLKIKNQSTEVMNGKFYPQRLTLPIGRRNFTSGRVKGMVRGEFMDSKAFARTNCKCWSSNKRESTSRKTPVKTHVGKSTENFSSV